MAVRDWLARRQPKRHYLTTAILAASRVFFLLRGPSPAHRFAVPPEHLQQTCSRHSSRAKATAPCERSGLLGRSSLGMPYLLQRLHLVYTLVVPNHHVRSGYLDEVDASLDITRVERHVSRHQIELYSDLQNGESVYRTKIFSVLEVALCEPTYDKQWHNFSAALKNMAAPRRYSMGITTFANLAKRVFLPALNTVPGRVKLLMDVQRWVHNGVGKVKVFIIVYSRPVGVERGVFKIGHARNAFKGVAQLQYTVASSKFWRKLNPYRSLLEPLGVRVVRQSVVITNKPRSIDQNQQLLVRFLNLGKDDAIVPGLAFTIMLDSEDVNRTVVQWFRTWAAPT